MWSLMQSVLATGHPAIPTGDFDFTPLVYVADHPGRAAPGTCSVQDLGVPDRARRRRADRLDLGRAAPLDRHDRARPCVGRAPHALAEALDTSAPPFGGLTDNPPMWLDTRASRRPIREGDRMSERKVGSVTYQEVGEEYFKERGLRRHAGVWSLWALGVGAVISGEFYGWNFGLGTGGFGGLLIAGVLMAVMYYGLVYSIAEMSPALPHTGGAYSFARSAMGPWGGFLTGLAENMEYVITPAVVVGAIGLLMQEITAGLFDVTGSPWWNSLPFWWAVFYIIFVGINVIGIEATMRFTVAITVLSIARPGLLLPRGDLLREARLLACGRTSRKMARRSRAEGARGCRSASAGSSSRSRSRSGSSSRSRKCRSPRRSRWTHVATSPRGRSGRCTRLLIAAILVLVINTALPGGAFLYGAVGVPAPGRALRDLRQREPRPSCSGCCS